MKRFALVKKHAGFYLAAVIAILVFCEARILGCVQLRHWTGQGVAPAYEGYDTNPDGSFNMWFGCMRTTTMKKSLTFRVGPDNTFRRDRPTGDNQLISP